MTSTSDPFLSALQQSPSDFLQPSLPLYTNTLAYLKHILDPLAKDVSAQQQQRQKEERKKRKRGEQDDTEALRLKQVHVEGFGAEQVWEQARRVISAAREEVERNRATLEVKDVVQAPDGGKKVKFVSFADDDLSDEEEDTEDELGVEGQDYEVEGIDDGDELYDEDGDSELDGEDALEDEDIDMDMEDASDKEDVAEDEPAAELISDKFGLNDGFFSIDNFNRQSEFLEQQDVRGEADGAASDEEDVDWDADPLSQAAAAQSIDDAVEVESEDDGNGPTFGDPDASSEDEDDGIEGGEMDGLGDMANTNQIMYAEFFAPPAQKKNKNKKGRPNPHNFPAKSDAQLAGQEDDIERTMAAVHRDLFDDEESEQDEEVEAEQLDPSDPRSRKSTHERRKAAIAEEIRKLEAANVAKREWTLSGEARAADRPMNSLLEEDLDFERAGKPVPVITAEVSESIEELIKRRVLALDFQDIPRRRPDDLATGKDSRRGRLDFELDDTKSKKGLAEEYEEEHLRRTDPNYVDAKDQKLAKEQKEIENLWKEVCGQLDSLSSWNFRPKQAAPQLDIRVDAPAINMEDARPSAGGTVAGASQLAPQEVYKGGEASKDSRAEVTGKSGLPAGREEMSREEKKSRRQRDKERKKKAGGNDDGKKESKTSKEKKELLGDLKRGGVRVIGKKGEVEDVEGRRAIATTDGGSGQGGGRYKL